MIKIFKYLLLIIYFLLIFGCAKEKVIKRFHLTKSKEVFFFEFQPQVWKKVYISPKIEETSKAKFTLSLINIKKDKILKLDPKKQSAFLILSGRGLFYNTEKSFILKEDIAGYGYGYPSIILAKEEIKLILLEKEPKEKIEDKMTTKNIFWIKKIELPKHKNIYAKIIFHPQKDKTGFLFSLVILPKGGANINYDIHPEEHGIFCIKGRISGKFYQEEKEVVVEREDCIYVEGNLPHIFKGKALESILIVYKG
jgi:mannose-6-phosphate isomerase-like protein (cupin superfamily)